MELGLSLGDHSTSSPFMFLPKQQQQKKISMSSSNGNGILKNPDKICGLGLGMCMGLGINSVEEKESNQKNDDMEEDDDHTYEEEDQDQDDDDDDEEVNGDDHRDVSCQQQQQLDLLPLLSVPRWPSSSHSHNNNNRMSSGNVNSLLQLGGGRGGVSGAATACEVTSANSVVSAAARFSMDFDIFKGGSGNLSSGGGTEGKDDDEDENYINGVNTKKKLRLSKEQSAYLEESFKEHHTLNPKQKLALAKQLNLRPRQIEVWFQNRRARTKLKQTEVDCEYLKRCCETLTEENKRLHKELQELRVLKTSNPFYMQVPATTLTMCSSCEKVTTTTTTSPPTTIAASETDMSAPTKAIPFPLSRSTRHYPFSQKTTNHPPPPPNESST